MMMATTATSTASRQVNCRETRRSNQFTAAAPRLNAECRMQNAKSRATHFAFRILHFAFCSSRILDRSEYLQKVHRRAHIVNAHDRRPSANGCSDRGE